LNIKPAIAAPGEPGTVDTTFSTTTASVSSLGVQSTGEIIVGMSVSPWMKRLSATGADLAFTNSATNSVGALSVATDNSVFSISQITASPVRKTNSVSGQLWASTTSVRAQPGSSPIAQLSDTSIVFGSRTAPYLHKFDSSGALDATFNTNVALAANAIPAGTVTTVKSQTVGGTEKILISGPTENGSIIRFLKTVKVAGKLFGKKINWLALQIIWFILRCY
jgi:hypothetical protein